MGGARLVRSVEEEEELIGSCRCGSPWRLALNDMWPVSGGWYDIVGLRCPECGANALFAFDVTSFFEPRPGVWTRERPLPVGALHALAGVADGCPLRVRRHDVTPGSPR